MRRTIRILAITAVSALLLNGCGWGGFTFNSGPSVSVMADYTTPPVSVQVGPPNTLPFDVQVTATPPPGFTCNPSPCTVTTRGDVDFRFDTATTVPAGTYTIAFHAQGGGWTRDSTAQVQVVAWNGLAPPPDFAFSVDPASITLTPGPKAKSDGTVHYSFSVARYNHYTGPIAITTQLADNETCTPSACSAMITGNSVAAPFTVTVAGSDFGRTNVFTATAEQSVVRTANGVVLVYIPPPPPSPGPSPQ